MPDPSVLFPHALEGTLGAGQRQFVGDEGEFQGMPYRGTPPFGEPVLNDEFDEAVWPIDPPIDPAYEDAYLHGQMHGTPWHGYFIQGWVNPSNPGIPNLGPVNEQPFYSGHSQITVPNPSAEQGWGMDPAVLLPRFPHSEGVNPFYSSGRYRRNGQLEFNSAGIPFGSVTQQRVQALTIGTRNRSSVHDRLADFQPGVPYSSTIVPVGGQAGPQALYAYAPLPTEDDGIY